VQRYIFFFILQKKDLANSRNGIFVFDAIGLCKEIGDEIGDVRLFVGLNQGDGSVSVLFGFVAVGQGVGVAITYSL